MSTEKKEPEGKNSRAADTAFFTRPRHCARLEPPFCRRNRRPFNYLRDRRVFVETHRASRFFSSLFAVYSRYPRNRFYSGVTDSIKTKFHRFDTNIRRKTKKSSNASDVLRLQNRPNLVFLRSRSDLTDSDRRNRSRRSLARCFAMDRRCSLSATGLRSSTPRDIKGSKIVGASDRKHGLRTRTGDIYSRWDRGRY